MESSKCNCKQSKLSVGMLLSLGFILSALSDLDCEFALVDVGFSPQNTLYDIQSDGIIGIGLWTIEDLDGGGFCLMPVVERGDESLTYDDDMYNTFFTGDDLVFSTVRILSLVGALVGLINLVLTWSLLFSVLEIDRTTTMYILHMTIVSFLCEGLKIGLMFVSPPCVSAFWEGEAREYGSYKRKADQCFIGRGCYMSILAAFFYFCVTIHIIISQFYSDQPHEQEDTIAFDDLSMPSYLHSIGESCSVGSKFSSSGGSSILSRARSIGSYRSLQSGQNSSFRNSKRNLYYSSGGSTSARKSSRRLNYGSGSSSGASRSRRGLNYGSGSSSGANRSMRGLNYGSGNSSSGTRRSRESSASISSSSNRGRRSLDHRPEELPMIGEETGQATGSGVFEYEYYDDQ